MAINTLHRVNYNAKYDHLYNLKKWEFRIYNYCKVTMKIYIQIISVKIVLI